MHFAESSNWTSKRENHEFLMQQTKFRSKQKLMGILKYNCHSHHLLWDITSCKAQGQTFTIKSNLTGALSKTLWYMNNKIPYYMAFWPISTNFVCLLKMSNRISRDAHTVRLGMILSAPPIGIVFPLLIHSSKHARHTEITRIDPAHFLIGNYLKKCRSQEHEFS